MVFLNFFAALDTIIDHKAILFKVSLVTHNDSQFPTASSVTFYGIPLASAKRTTRKVGIQRKHWTPKEHLRIYAVITFA